VDIYFSNFMLEFLFCTFSNMKFEFRFGIYVWIKKKTNLKAKIEKKKARPRSAALGLIPRRPKSPSRAAHEHCSFPPRSSPPSRVRAWTCCRSGPIWLCLPTPHPNPVAMTCGAKASDFSSPWSRIWPLLVNASCRSPRRRSRVVTPCLTDVPAPLASAAAVTPSPPGYNTPCLAQLTSPTPWPWISLSGKRRPPFVLLPLALWPRTGHWFSPMSQALVSSRFMAAHPSPVAASGPLFSLGRVTHDPASSKLLPAPFALHWATCCICPN
jgi:hypothetical protein